MDDDPLKQPSKPPPKRPKSSQQKRMTLHPPLASLTRLPNGELRVPSPLAKYASMRSRTSSVLDYNHSIDQQESKSSQRSSSTSPQYLVYPEVIRSSMLAAQKSFQSRVRPREWVPDGSQENVPREFIEITQQHKSPNAAINEALLDPLARDRVATLRATLEQLFFKLHNVEQLQADPVFGPDTGADLELGECNMPIEDFTKFTAGVLHSESPAHIDSNFDMAVRDTKKSDAIVTSFALSKAADSSQITHLNTTQDSHLPPCEIVSQDHDGEMNDFLLGDACKIGHLLAPLPSIELDKQLVSFSDKQGLSEMDIFGLAFDTCIDYLSSCNTNGQITEILQTLSRVKAYYVKRITSTPTQLAAYQEAANILDNKLQVTVRDLKEATHENQDLKIKLTSLKGNYAEAVKRIDDLVCQNTMQARDMTILTRRLNVAQDQVTQLSFTLDVIKSELLDERNKTKRLAATANRFKSNLERVGDRAAQAERKANYGELQILDLEKQNKTMMAEMAVLQEQLSTITGAFAKERGALVSENERLTMENNDFQTTLASGGMFFASGADEGEANSEILVRVANKIHKRTDMSPHAKLAATTILRLCAEDSRVACRRLGITNDGLSSIMWLVTAAKNSDNVATFLTHLHGQYSSYFVAKGTAVQTKESYMMDVKSKNKKRAIDAALNEIKNIRVTNPNGEISGSIDNKVYNSFDDECTDPYTSSTNLLLKKSQAVLLNMHRQLQIYREKYDHLSTDSDKEFNELQALFVEYYQGKTYNDNSSMSIDLYQKSSCEDQLSIPCNTGFNQLFKPGGLKDVDALLDDSDSHVYNVSGESLPQYLNQEGASAHPKEDTHHNSTIPPMNISKTIPAHDIQAGACTSTSEKSSPQQNEALLPNISMDSIDFGGHYASSQLIDESTEFFIEADSQEDNLQINIVDIPEEIVNALNTKIAAIAALSTSQEQKDKIALLLQNLLYKSNYNGSILQIFDEYANKIIQDNAQMREVPLQQKSDASIDDSNSPEVAAASETTTGIVTLCQILDNIFDEPAQQDHHQKGIELLLDEGLSACTKETINWVVEQIKPKIERARRKRAAKHRLTAKLTDANDTAPNFKKLGLPPGRKPLPSACTSAQQTQRVFIQKDKLEQTADEIRSPYEDQVSIEMDSDVGAPIEKGDKYLYYKDANGELRAIKHSLVRTDDGCAPKGSHPSGNEGSEPLQGSSFQSASPRGLLSPQISSSPRRFSSKDHLAQGVASSLTGNIVDLNTVALGDTHLTSDLPPALPTMLIQSKRVASPARSTDSRQSSSRLKSGSPSKRHFYGLSTQDILARVSENTREDSWLATRPLSSLSKPGCSSQHSNRSESKFLMQTPDGAIRFVDASSVKSNAPDGLSIMERDKHTITSTVYYAEGADTGMLLVTFTPDAIPASLNAVIEKKETILISNRRDTLDREKIPVTIFSINSSTTPLLSTIESMENTSIMFVAHPLPLALARAIKEGTVATAVATQTDPMILDEMISTCDFLVNDAFVVIDKLFTAMCADPLQTEQTSMQVSANAIQTDSLPGNKDEALDLAMSQFTSVPLFPDIYMTEQLVSRNESHPNDEMCKDTKQSNELVSRASPLLSLLQKHLPANLPLVTRGLLGPSGIVKYSNNNLQNRPSFAQPGIISKEGKALSDSKSAHERPKTAINLNSPITAYLRSLAESQFDTGPNTKEELNTIIDTLSPSIVQQASLLDIRGPHGSVKQTINTDLRYAREDMTLSATTEELIDNNSRSYKEAVLELLSVSQRHKSLPAQRLRQSTNINSLVSESLKQENNIGEGSLLIESLTPKEARGGSLLLRRQQQQSMHTIDFGKQILGPTSAEERTLLQNRRFENKILSNTKDKVQPPFLSATFIGVKQDGNPPQEPILTYSEYLHMHGRDSLPSHVTSVSYSARPYLRIHPRHGQNILFTQCNPLEPPEGPLLQFVGGPLAALVTKFGSFKRAQHTLAHNLLDLAHPHSEEHHTIYPCVLSAHTDIVKDFYPNSSEGKPQKQRPTIYKMQKTIEYMMESIKHLPSMALVGESMARDSSSLAESFRVTAKQFSNVKMLMPRPGDAVLYIRHSALSVKKNDSKPLIPIILQLLQELSPHRCELFTVETGSAVDTMHKTYIKIPIVNAYLKSSVWTLKLIRAIYGSRLSMEESYLTVKEPTEQVLVASLNPDDRGEAENELDHIPSKTDSAKTDGLQSRFFSFDVVHGGLSRQEAESLPHFLLYYAKNKYGVNTIVAPLLWSLVVSVCYHQYENNEIYLFARFLFNDLDFDFYLTYLDIQRALGGSLRDTVDLAEVPELVHVILPNWSSKRRYSLCESIYSCKLVQRGKQAYTIDAVRLAQMILGAYGGYRRAIFESMTLIWSKVSTENFLTEGGFREFCDTCITLLNFNSITEVFYAFSVECKSDVPAIALSNDQGTAESCVLADTAHNLACRRMYYTSFIDFYLSYCLGRYAIISSLTLDEAMRGTPTKRNIQMASKVYERLVVLSQDIATKKLSSIEEEAHIQRQELTKAIRKVFNHLNLASCDISAYDSQRAIDNMRQGINLLTDCCMDAKSEAASIVLGGGVAALSAFITRNY